MSSPEFDILESLGIFEYFEVSEEQAIRQQCYLDLDDDDDDDDDDDVDVDEGGRGAISPK